MRKAGERAARRAVAQAEWDREENAQRASAFAVFRRVAEPCVAVGVAQLRSDDRGAIGLVPGKQAAAAMWLALEETRANRFTLFAGDLLLQVGPHGVAHKIQTWDHITREWIPDADWAPDLEACLQAVVEGRYSEQVSQDGRKLVMTFSGTKLDGADVVTEHRLEGLKPGRTCYEPYDSVR